MVRLGIILLVVSFCASTGFCQPLQWEKLINPGECPPIMCSYVDSTTVYLGTKFGTVFRSTDEGLSWSQLNEPWKDVRIQGVAARHDSIYVATDSSLYWSSDNGKTWTWVDNFMHYHGELFPCYGGPLGIEGNRLLIGTQFSSCLSTELPPHAPFKRECGGGPSIVLTIFTSKAHGSFVGQTIGGLFQDSAQDGMQWEMKDTGYPKLSDIYFGVQAICELGGSFFTVTDSGFFRSDDGTDHWSLVNTVLKSGFAYVGNTYALVSHDNYLFAGTDSGILRSSNKGASWQLVNADITDTVRTLAVVGNTLLAGTHFCVYRSTDNGDTWKPSISGLTYRLYPVTCFAPANKKLYGGTDGGGVYASTNEGLSWSAVNGGLSSLSVRALAYHDSRVYAALPEGPAYNSGSLWNLQIDGLSNTASYTFFESGSILYLGTGQGGVYRLPPGDSLWHVVGKNLSSTAIVSITTFGSTILAGTNGSGAFSSNDDGQSWQSITGITDQRVVGLATVGDQLFAGTGGSGVFRSLDGGAHWETVNNGLTNQKVRSLISFGALLFAATDDGVFESKDQGANWVQEKNGLETVKMASLRIAGTYIYASTNGSGIYRAYLGERKVPSLKKESAQLQLYPNPAAESVTIVIPATIPGGSKIAVRDVLGNIIYESKTPYEKIPALELPLRALESGSYIVSMTVGGSEYLGRLTVVH